jgi:hypothetical protein
MAMNRIIHFAIWGAEAAVIFGIAVLIVWVLAGDRRR